VEENKVVKLRGSLTFSRFNGAFEDTTTLELGILSVK
jgi:hypothetical protein